MIILPTEQCNFRCSYCYEDFKIGKMRPNVINGINNLINHRGPTLRFLHLSWFGGEPLFASDVVLHISKAARHLSQKYGFKLNGTVTTNGWYLDKDLLIQLLDYEQNQFQITLDGWEDTHDRTRKLRSGAGTFNRIWANLLAARDVERDFRVLLRLHLTESNFSSLEVLCARIAEEFGNDDRFHFNFQDVRPLGGPGNSSTRRMDEADVQCRIDRLSTLLCSRSPRVVTEDRFASHSSVEAQQYICYASKANSLVIRADGSIAKCTVALSSQKNKIGRLHEDGTLDIDNELLRPWIRGLSTRNLSELSCPAAAMELF